MNYGWYIHDRPNSSMHYRHNIITANEEGSAYTKRPSIIYSVAIRKKGVGKRIRLLLGDKQRNELVIEKERERKERGPKGLLSCYWLITTTIIITTTTTRAIRAIHKEMLRMSISFLTRDITLKIPFWDS